MEVFELKNDNILPFKFKRLKSGKFFLSTDYGDWIVLSKEEFDDFIGGKDLSVDLIDKLKRNFIIKDDRFSDNELELLLSSKWANRYSYLHHGPTLHIMVVTLACNHACRYCHASAKMLGASKYNMSLEMAKKIVDVIFQTTSGNITIEFQGGEPLINWEVVRFVIEYARQKNEVYKFKMNFALVSNLTMMDDEKLDFLMAPDIDISTSLDGPADVHNFNRTYSGVNSFDEVTGWIRKITQEYKKRGIEKRVGAIATASRVSLDKWKEIVDTYVDLGLERLFIRPLNPYGFAVNTWDKIGYEEKDYVDFYEKVKDYIYELRNNGVNILDVYSDDICLRNLTRPQRMNYMEERSPCGAVLGQLAYNYDGGVYTCDEGRMLGTVHNDSFKVTHIDLSKSSKEIYSEIILSHVAKIMMYASLIDTLPGYETNPVSNYIGVCPIYSYTKSGNIVSKYRKEQRFKIQEYVIENLIEKNILK